MQIAKGWGWCHTGRAEGWYEWREEGEEEEDGEEDEEEEAWKEEEEEEGEREGKEGEGEEGEDEMGEFFKKEKLLSKKKKVLL
uniref:Uncharacterized protein n=1 Tax=Chromera velia CCMP2878 TaxID=1169474 RepID=A0A0G4HJU5_9ALVE|eukprot:Cvel_1120.t1-p1 / transcript=Cvel_1120.t1 / gene=Cvel_1120 / organism=Chromera_velia_CCMP2878 / gene_product=hypothetical protein / transcript_product=hypothetical protein / location=Cvel_scaffold36:163258-163503(-) / protein_length=82 / sequence_SO=supercontig / SO=protein_coding / is_pseudo=false